MTGYSGTPLARKLGIRKGARVLVCDPPRGFRSLLAPLPPGVKFLRTDESADLVHLFARSRPELDRELGTRAPRLADEAALWVSWPKKSSGVQTDVTEDVVRAVALPLGLVDVKVCAVDETWSALKLVRRRELRSGVRPRPRK